MRYNANEKTIHHSTNDENISNFRPQYDLQSSPQSWTSNVKAQQRNKLIKVQ